jgi:hypothetical protein
VIRELVVLWVVLLIGSPLAWLFGLCLREPGEVAHGGEFERRHWRRVWLPHLPLAVMVVMLLGWALQEPPISDEIVHPIATAVAIGFALLWMRALLRALRAISRPHREPLAATRGLIWPKVRISDELAGALDADALHAVRLHEEAHVRHRDPLRIWLAQLATDLQFPSRKARARFNRWLAALEIARDDEARRNGADGAALASAIVTGARLQSPSGVPAPCGLTGRPESLEYRVVRLLAPLPAEPEAKGKMLLFRLGLALFLAVDVATGFVVGNEIVRAIPGVLG